MWDLTIKPSHKKEFEAFKPKIKGFKTEIEGYKVGDIISFRNGYDVLMKAEILGFDKDDDIYLNWEYYWSPIRQKRECQIQKVSLFSNIFYPVSWCNNEREQCNY